MKVAELIQELLNMDPTLEVNIYDEESGQYEPVHSWDHIYGVGVDENGDAAAPIEGVVLWPRYCY